MENNGELKEILNAINKKFGDGSLIPATQMDLKIDRLPSGIFSLDIELGGGLPTGRIVEIFGKEQSLKSTVALRVIAQAQKVGKLCAYIDAEGRLDISWAKKQGVNIETLLFSRPDTGEKTGDIVDSLVRSGKFAIIVIDSVSALIPQLDTEQTMTETEKIGGRAQLCNRLIRKVHSGLNLKDEQGNSNQTCVIFINQIRMKIGSYGNPEDSTGGLGLRFGASVRIEVRKSEYLKHKDNIVGFILKFKIIKNTTFMPYRVGQFKFYLDGRIDNITSLVDYGITLGVIKTGGPIYTFDGEKIKGRDVLVRRVLDDEKFRKKLAVQVREAYGNTKLPEIIEDPKKKEEEQK